MLTIIYCSIVCDLRNESKSYLQLKWLVPSVETLGKVLQANITKEITLKKSILVARTQKKNLGAVCLVASLLYIQIKQRVQ